MSLIIKKNTTFKIPRTGSGVTAPWEFITTSNYLPTNYRRISGSLTTLPSLYAVAYVAGPNYAYVEVGDYPSYYIFGPQMYFSDASGNVLANSLNNPNPNTWKLVTISYDSEYDAYNFDYFNTNNSTNPYVVPPNGWPSSMLISITA
jgi:hypothetical protein